MEERYIDADKLLEYLEKEVETEEVKYSVIGAGVQATINEIKKFHREDVAPVTHAHWIEKKYRIAPDVFISNASCSACAGISKTGYTDYCPHCGAKMDEGAEK